MRAFDHLFFNLLTFVLMYKYNFHVCGDHDEMQVMETMTAHEQELGRQIVMQNNIISHLKKGSAELANEAQIEGLKAEVQIKSNEVAELTDKLMIVQGQLESHKERVLKYKQQDEQDQVRRKQTKTHDCLMGALVSRMNDHFH
jgi:predicted RNase H-like nuclease (RuvC/YqgF family)